MYHDYDGERESRKEELFPFLLTPSEVMDILGVGKNTVYRLLNEGKLEAFRVGRCWRISSQGLELFMKTHEY